MIVVGCLSNIERDSFFYTWPAKTTDGNELRWYYDTAILNTERVLKGKTQSETIPVAWPARQEYHPDDKKLVGAQVDFLDPIEGQQAIWLAYASDDRDGKQYAHFFGVVSAPLDSIVAIKDCIEVRNNKGN